MPHACSLLFQRSLRASEDEGDPADVDEVDANCVFSLRSLSQEWSDECVGSRRRSSTNTGGCTDCRASVEGNGPVHTDVGATLSGCGVDELRRRRLSGPNTLELPCTSRPLCWYV